jgi:hypothetical protein
MGAVSRTTVMLSRYTRGGVLRHTALVNGLPIIPETDDANVASDAAKRAYHETPGHAVLVRWDGDTQKEKEVKSK